MGCLSSTLYVPMVIKFRTETTQGSYHVRVTKNGYTFKTSSNYRFCLQVIRSKGVPLEGKMTEGDVLEERIAPPHKSTWNTTPPRPNMAPQATHQTDTLFDLMWEKWRCIQPWTWTLLNVSLMLHDFIFKMYHMKYRNKFEYSRNAFNFSNGILELIE